LVILYQDKLGIDKGQGSTMSDLFQQKILNKRTAVFSMASLLMGFIFDIYKWYEMPNVDNFYAGAFFICIYVFIDIYMMHKMLGMKVDSCLDRFFSPVKNNMHNIMCFILFFIPCSLYFQGSMPLFSIVVIGITVGDLYFFYHNTQEDNVFGSTRTNF
jgi:hypothetical protein